MIAPLRRRHRWTFVLLAIVLPPLVAVAIGQRPGRDLAGTPLSAEAAAPIPSSSIVLEGMFADRTLTGHLWQEGSQAVLAIDSQGAARQPDLLLYWTPSPDDDPSKTGLPATAVLLGPLPSRTLRLYSLPTATAGGQLLLYSLAHQELSGRAALPELAAPSPQPGDVTESATAPEADREEPSQPRGQR